MQRFLPITKVRGIHAVSFLMRSFFSLFFFFSVFLSANDILLIGIAGGTGSGKTTLARTIANTFAGKVILISQDNYYKSLDYLSLEERAKKNFDHPQAIDFDLLYKQLIDLKNSKTVKMPSYDFSLHARNGQTTCLKPKKIIILEGILIFVEKRIRDLLDIKLYVDTDDDIRLLRRVERDMKERDRTFDSIKQQYLATVAPMHKIFVEPTKKFADFIVPGNINNQVAVNLIIENLKAHVAKNLLLPVEENTKF